MAIKIYKCPMIAEPTTDQKGYEYICYIDANYPMAKGDSRIVMRINMKECLVAIDTDYEDPEMATDINLEQMLWGSNKKITTDLATTIANDFDLDIDKINNTKNVAEVFDSVLQRTTPEYSIEVLQKLMSTGRWYWIDLVSSEMGL